MNCWLHVPGVRRQSGGVRTAYFIVRKQTLRLLGGKALMAGSVSVHLQRVMCEAQRGTEILQECSVFWSNMNDTENSEAA